MCRYRAGGGRAKPCVWPINSGQVLRYLARNTVVAKPVGDDDTVLPAKDDHAITLDLSHHRRPVPGIPGHKSRIFFELKLIHKKQTITVNEIIVFDMVLQNFHRLVGSNAIRSSQRSA